MTLPTYSDLDETRRFSVVMSSFTHGSSAVDALETFFIQVMSGDVCAEIHDEENEDTTEWDTLSEAGAEISEAARIAMIAANLPDPDALSAHQRLHLAAHLKDYCARLGRGGAR